MKRGIADGACEVRRGQGAGRVGPSNDFDFCSHCERKGFEQSSDMIRHMVSKDHSVNCGGWRKRAKERKKLRCLWHDYMCDGWFLVCDII